MNAENNLPFDETKTAEIIVSMTSLLKTLKKLQYNLGRWAQKLPIAFNYENVVDLKDFKM